MATKGKDQREFLDMGVDEGRPTKETRQRAPQGRETSTRKKKVGDDDERKKKGAQPIAAKRPKEKKPRVFFVWRRHKGAREPSEGRRAGGRDRTAADGDEAAIFLRRLLQTE